ncbi:MAG: 1-acyl-sn-glycerol-3-phosphate acyltransferase [Gammaproteobacteria bacterium]|nr:1-acyl-sn-glycerol-3-phosphate acyltransferase [Gammaproteobacteria bacterium]
MHPTLGVLRLRRTPSRDVANHHGWGHSDQLRAELRMLFQLLTTTKRKLNLHKREDNRILNRFALNLYKWFAILPTLLLTTIVIGSCIVVMSALKVPPSGSQRLASFWARINTKVCLIKLEIIGLKHLQHDQSYILVANHLSLVDIYILYGFLGKNLKWVMKKELRLVPFLGQACVALGNIFVDRKNTEFDLNALREAKENIKKGDSVIFFPEGTRSRDGSLGSFKKGAFRMARDLEFPIVPITLHDTHQVLATDSIDWKPGKVTMQIHRPIQVNSEADPNKLALETRDIIRKSLIGKTEVHKAE